MIDFVARISCMTYNHAPYISDAMNGFVLQKTDFPFLVVVVDDASTDGEPEIINQYLVDHFNKKVLDISTADETDEYTRIFAQHKENKNCYFLVFLLKYNHYSIGKPKLTSVYDLIESIPYIGICEGDDYWSDPMKLQKQVLFLENHNDYGFVGTNILVDQGGRIRKEPPLFLPKVFEGDFALIGDVFEDAIGGPVTRTVSLLYKRQLLAPYSEYDISGDILLESVLAKQSKYACYQGYASVYRVGVGVSSSHNDLDRALRYNDFIVRSRKLQNQLFPDDCSFSIDELEDREQYIRLIYAIRKMKWKIALRYKNKLKSTMYRNKTYSRYLYGPFSCAVLKAALIIKHHE